jgi:hypothetical protein
MVQQVVRVRRQPEFARAAVDEFRLQFFFQRPFQKINLAKT